MIDMIKSRRSIRSYTEEKVKEEDLKEIVECGLLAPSGMNTQRIHSISSFFFGLVPV